MFISYLFIYAFTPLLMIIILLFPIIKSEIRIVKGVCMIKCYYWEYEITKMVILSNIRLWVFLKKVNPGKLFGRMLSVYFFIYDKLINKMTSLWQSITKTWYTMTLLPCHENAKADISNSKFQLTHSF